MERENETRIAVDRLVRDERARILSALMAFCRDLELSQDIFHDALLAALATWPERGIPANPRAWILATAQRKAIDRFRREARFSSRQDEIVRMQEAIHEQESEMIDADFPDNRLKLIFTCCHPALSSQAQIALTLRVVGGMTTPQIARAFLVGESTMAQRLVRAQRKIRSAGIPYEVPAREYWPERIETVLSVIYLIFNEGYASSFGQEPVQRDLCREAIFLGEILNSLLPREPEVQGLLALMLLHDSRTAARSVRQGELITLESQDRTLWDRNQIARGRALLLGALSRSHAGPYQIQAAISAIHSEAGSFAETDWKQICLLYELLYEKQPTPVVLLNAAVALSYGRSPEAGLRALNEIARSATLDNYQPYHAARADMAQRAGQLETARQAYERALSMSTNQPERDYLVSRLADCTARH